MLFRDEHIDMSGQTEMNMLGSLDDPCKVIAEVGVNHNGSLETAKTLIDRASDAAVDVVKFQTFVPEEIVSEGTEKAAYQERAESKTQYEMLERVSLSRSEIDELADYCEQQGLEFMSTPYDPQSVDVIESVGVERYKIASADIINKPLLEAVVETGKPVILSTGMATLGEIERTVNWLQTNDCTDFSLLHCVSCYPAEPWQVNMRFMETLSMAFDVPVGFSDHTLGTHIPVMAASCGATVIEKHFTLDRTMEGPDHFASLEPDELATMVDKIQDVEAAMGETTRILTDAELENRRPMRRSIHTRKSLNAGTNISRDDVKIIRPNDGIDPWHFDDIIGSTLSRDVAPNEALKWSNIK